MKTDELKLRLFFRLDHITDMLTNLSMLDVPAIKDHDPELQVVFNHLMHIRNDCLQLQNKLIPGR